MRISQIEKPAAKDTGDSFDFAAQTFAIHEYLHSWMCDFRPTWQPKWDAALGEQRWADIQKLMSAIIQQLPASEQSLLVPAMLDFMPWEDDMKMYWPTVWILDKHGTRHGRIAMQIFARSKEEALKKIPKNYELKSW